MVMAINQEVFAFGPATFGWLRDSTGNYVAAFALAAIAQIAAAAIVASGRLGCREG